MRKNAKNSIPPLAYQLPYWDIEENVLVHVDGAFTKGLELNGLDAQCLSNDRLNEISRLLRVWLNSLPLDVFVQIHRITDEDTKEELDRYYGSLSINDRRSRLLFDDRKKILEGPLARRFRLFMFFTKHVPLEKPSWFKFKNNSRPFQPEQRHHEAVKYLEKIYSEAASMFSQNGLGIQARALTDEDYFKILFEYLNPRKHASASGARPNDRVDCHNASNPVPKPFVTLREKTALSSCVEFQDRLILDDTFVRVISLSGMPDNTYPTMVDELIYKLDFPLRVVAAFNMLDTAAYLGKLRMRGRRKKMLLSLNKNRNIETEVSSQEIDDFEEEIVRCNERIGQFGLFVVVTAECEEVLSERTQGVLSLVKAMANAAGRVEEFSQFNYFLAALPGNAFLGSDRHHICTTKNISNLIPLSTPWRGTSDSWALLHSDRQSLVRFCPFSRELSSYNQIVIGQTGVGKSFLINVLLNLYLLKNPDLKVFILDMGGSYKRFVQFWGGQYVDFNLNCPSVSLSPFIPAKEIWISQDGEFDRHAISTIAAITEQMVSDSPESGLGRLEYALLEDSVRKTYQHLQDHTPSFKDLQYVLLNYSRYSNDPEDIRLARGLGKRLLPWTEGPYAKLFAGSSPLEVHHPLFCFDIQGTTEDKNVLGVIMSIVAHRLFLEMTRNYDQKIFVGDEFWAPMSHRTGKLFFEGVFRTGRKYHMSTIASTQGSIDFKRSEASKTVLNQSKIRWILKIRDNPKEMQDILQLSGRELSLASHLTMRRGEYSQALLQCEEFASVVTLYSSPLLYWLASTNPQDRQIEAEYKRRFGEKSDLEILDLLSKEFPRGYPGKG